MSPFKATPQKPEMGGTAAKKTNNFFQDDDFNDRVELDRSIKVVGSSNKKAQYTSVKPKQISGQNQ